MSTGHSPEQLAAENQRLRRAVAELSVLNEIATAISSTQSLDDIIQLMVRKCVKHLQVEQAAVMLLETEGDNQMLQTMVRQADSSTSFLPYRLDAELTGWMLHHRKPLLVTDLASDERFSSRTGDDIPVRSLISVPLVHQGKMIGTLTVFNKKTPEGFSAEDQRLLAIIGSQSAQVIENARLLKEEQALIRMQEEMRTAREIQDHLLPDNPTGLEGYDIAGHSIAAKEVGGDYYDFITLPDGRLAFSIGDITGKGLPAAMLMANTQATIRTCAVLNPEPAQVLENANRLLHDSTGIGKFVTLFYGVVDPVNHTITYTNAGHDQPYFLNADGSLQRLSTGGMVVGFMPNSSYEQETVPLTPGSRLVLYSDGITEAMDAADTEFGEARLESLATDHRGNPAADFIEAAMSAVRAHAGDTPQSDDMTLVVVGRK